MHYTSPAHTCMQQNFALKDILVCIVLGHVSSLQALCNVLCKSSTYLLAKNPSSCHEYIIFAAYRLFSLTHILVFGNTQFFYEGWPRWSDRPRERDRGRVWYRCVALLLVVCVRGVEGWSSRADSLPYRLMSLSPMWSPAWEFHVTDDVTMAAP